jgi:hypothetical protein
MVAVAPGSLARGGSKESNLLDEIQAGLIGDEELVLTEYRDEKLDPFVVAVLPVLREIPLGRLVAETGLHPSTIKRIRSGAVRASEMSRELLTRAAGMHARQRLAWLTAEEGFRRGSSLVS